jgi:hypothetical protein
MHELPLEQIRDGREPNVRMRPHVDACPGLEADRAHVVDEDKWSHHLLLERGQHAADHEAAEVARAGADDVFDGRWQSFVPNRRIAIRATIW